MACQANFGHFYQVSFGILRIYLYSFNTIPVCKLSFMAHPKENGYTERINGYIDSTPEKYYEWHYFYIRFPRERNEVLNMKKNIPIALLVMLLLTTCFQHGAIAEDALIFLPFEGENMRGDGIVTDAMFTEAEITIVNFWATWCPPCITELPYLAGLSEASDGRAQVLGILLDGVTIDRNGEFSRDPQALRYMDILLDESGATFPVILPEDPQLTANASIIISIPTSFVVNSKGEIVDTVVGLRTASQWLDIVEKAIGE
jgi:thiol-disulfide isomerase/thioredoxin